MVICYRGYQCLIVTTTPVVISNGEDILYIPPLSRLSFPLLFLPPLPTFLSDFEWNRTDMWHSSASFFYKTSAPRLILTIYFQVTWCIKYSWLAEQMAAATLDWYGCVCMCVCVCVYLLFISLFVVKLYLLSQETSQNLEKLSQNSSRSDTSLLCWQSAVDNQRINCLIWFGLALWFVKTNKKFRTM